MELLRVDRGRCGGSGGNESSGELLIRKLLLRLIMLDLATRRGMLHLVDSSVVVIARRRVVV